MGCSARLCLLVISLLAFSGGLVPAATADAAWHKQQNQQQVQHEQQRALPGGRHLHTVFTDSTKDSSQQLLSRRLAAHGDRLRQARTLLQAVPLGSSSSATVPSGGILQGLAGSWSVNFDWNPGQPTSPSDPSSKAIQVQVGAAVSPTPSPSNTRGSGSSGTTQPPPITSSSNPSVTSTSSNSRNPNPQQLQNTTAVPQPQDDLCSSFRAATDGPTPPSNSNIDYYYMRPDGHEGNPLALPLADAPDGLPWMSRWVMCAWSVSNFSSPAMLSDAAMEQVQGLVNNFSAMAPGQVCIVRGLRLHLGWEGTGG
jgi:hypothetical protein